MAFFAYVWALWAAKALAARRYRPATRVAGPLSTSVIVPVYNEPEPLFRRVLASVVANRPSELIAVVDGGDARARRGRAEYCDRVLRIPKSGKRAAIDAGLRASDPAPTSSSCVDSDTVWAPGALQRDAAPVRRPARRRRHPAPGDLRRRRRTRSGGSRTGWRTSATTSPCRRSRCSARSAASPAARSPTGGPRSSRPSSGWCAQTVLGVPQHVGDDRVLTNELLRDGWRTVYQSTALVETDAPSDWRTFWRQQLRWGALEPARDAAEPALAVAPAGRVRQLRDRHRHAVRALRGRRARRRARPARRTGRDRPAARARAAARLPGDGRQHRRAPGGPRAPLPARPARGCRCSSCRSRS